MENFSPTKIFEPVFSSAELCSIAEIDRKLANLWLERGIIEPSRIEQLAVRSRPYFSVVAIFKARLIRDLSEVLDIGTSSSRVAAMGAEAADDPSAYGPDLRRIVNVAASAEWMRGSARAAERGKPLHFHAGLSRSEKCWEFQMDMDVLKLVRHFGSVPLILIPIGDVFDAIYLKCKATYEGRGHA